MDQAKIAFIMCVNNADEYAESKYYIDRLELPEGFEKDIVAVQDAPCMAAGYNVGMRSSDAQYKVYMHQDVCIINRHFVSDLLRIFRYLHKTRTYSCQHRNRY